MDPLVEVSVLGEKKFTSAKDDIGQTSVVTWNEHLFFEPRNVVWFDVSNLVGSGGHRSG